MHAPDSCGEDFCGKSARGPIGDAVEEMDWMVGQVMTALWHTPASPAAAAVAGGNVPLLANNTLAFFTVSVAIPFLFHVNANLVSLSATAVPGLALPKIAKC